MANITLYHFPRACSQVTMNALEEAGLEYDDIVINILKGEQKSPDYLKIHRSGKVPALVFDGKVMTENASILIFLDSLKPEAHLLPKTDDPVAKANMYSDLIWCSGTIHPAVRQVRMPVRFTDGDPSGVQEKGREYVHGIIAQVNEQVADGNWWYGEQWSIVDVYLNWLFTTAASAGFPVEQYPNVQDHMQRVQDRESFQRAKAREEAAQQRAGLEFPK